MKVTDSVRLDERHSIEFGYSTWDETSMSVRDRWATSTGGFSPRSSSEIPLGSIPDIMIETAKHDLLDVQTTARIIEALAASIARR